MRARTEQEHFWAGQFGDEYTRRNATPASQRRGFFESILRRAVGVTTVCELGANRGDNLAALCEIAPNLALTGVEVNEKAIQEMRAQVPQVTAVQSSIQDFGPQETYDLVFTCGVLIHIPPDDSEPGLRPSFCTEWEVRPTERVLQPSPS